MTYTLKWLSQIAYDAPSERNKSKIKAKYNDEHLLDHFVFESEKERFFAAYYESLLIIAFKGTDFHGLDDFKDDAGIVFNDIPNDLFKES